MTSSAKTPEENASTTPDTLARQLARSRWHIVIWLFEKLVVPAVLLVVGAGITVQMTGVRSDLKDLLQPAALTSKEDLGHVAGYRIRSLDSSFVGTVNHASAATVDERNDVVLLEAVGSDGRVLGTHTFEHSIDQAVAWKSTVDGRLECVVALRDSEGRATILRRFDPTAPLGSRWREWTLDLSAEHADHKAEINPYEHFGAVFIENIRPVECNGSVVLCCTVYDFHLPYGLIVLDDDLNEALRLWHPGTIHRTFALRAKAAAGNASKELLVFLGLNNRLWERSSVEREVKFSRRFIALLDLERLEAFPQRLYMPAPTQDSTLDQWHDDLKRLQSWPLLAESDSETLPPILQYHVFDEPDLTFNPKTVIQTRDRLMIDGWNEGLRKKLELEHNEYATLHPERFFYFRVSIDGNGWIQVAPRRKTSLSGPSHDAEPDNNALKLDPIPLKELLDNRLKGSDSHPDAGL